MDAGCNMDEPCKHDAQRKKATHCVHTMSPLISNRKTHKDRKQLVVVAKGWRIEGNEEMGFL